LMCKLLMMDAPNLQHGHEFQGTCYGIFVDLSRNSSFCV
jgi:hypothetical protein